MSHKNYGNDTIQVGDIVQVYGCGKDLYKVLELLPQDTYGKPSVELLSVWRHRISPPLVDVRLAPSEVAGCFEQHYKEEEERLWAQIAA